MTSLTATGTSGNDRLVLTALSWDSGRYSLNGGPAVYFSGITSFDFSGGDGDDVLTIDNPDGALFAPALGINFAAGGQPGDGLEIRGGTADNLLYTAGSTPDAGTLVYDSGPFAQMITFSGIAPVNDTVLATNFTFTAPVGATAAKYTNGPLVSGFQTSQINDNGTGTFELINLARKTNVTINASAAVLSLDNQLPPSGLASLAFNASRMVSVTPNDGIADVVANVLTLNATGPSNGNTGQIGSFSTSAQFVEVDASVLNASTNNSRLWIRDLTGGVAIGSVTAGTNTAFLHVAGGGNMTSEPSDPGVADIVAPRSTFGR
jgi:hypothetical protein